MKSLLVILVLLLQTQAPSTYNISGKVVKFTDAPDLPATLMMLRSYSAREGPGQGKTTTIRADGSFEFTGVLPGECDLNFYDPVVHYRSTGPGVNFTFSGHDVTGIQIKAPAGLNGRIVMADGGPIPNVIVTSRTTLSFNSSFRSARGMWTQANPGSDGRFTLGVFPGENTITVGPTGDTSGLLPLPAGYAVKSIRYGTVDIMTNGLVLTELPTSSLVITLEK